MKKLLLITCFIFSFYISIQAQYWKTYVDKEDDFVELISKENSEVISINRSSFFDYSQVVFNQDGTIQSEDFFTVGTNSFRPIDHVRIGNDLVALRYSNISSIEAFQFLKFDLDGNELFNTIFEEEDNFIKPTNITAGSSGAIYGTGLSRNKNSANEIFDIPVFELDENGNEVNRIFVEYLPQYNAGFGVQKNDAGNFIVLGASASSHPQNVNSFGKSLYSEPYILEVNPNGVIVNELSLTKACSQTYHNFIHLSEYKNGYLAIFRTYLIYFDSELNIIWDVFLDFEGSNLIVEEDEIIVAGKFSRSPSYIGYTKISETGQLLKSKVYSINSLDRFNSIGYEKLSNGNIVLAGIRRESISIDQQLYFISADSEGNYNSIHTENIFTNCENADLYNSNIGVTFENNCALIDSSKTLVFNSQSTCGHCIASQRIQLVKYIKEDDCGTIDSAIQMFHLQSMEPTADCCDVSIENYNQFGANVFYNPPEFSSPCDMYFTYSIETMSSIVSGDFLDYGEYTIDYLVTDECNQNTYTYTLNISILETDADNDGFNEFEDCDDTNPNINPDAMEIANNDVDENCDGVALIIDEDMDGFNSDEDCDDMNADINPDAMEITNNDVDEDCDGVALIIDEDMDGFNSDEDCDDMNADINPDAMEITNNDVDEDCDGVALIIDEDMDGFNSDEDCDDMNADINPDAIEIPNNGIDEDCDGVDSTSTNIIEIINPVFAVFPIPATSTLYISSDYQNTYSIEIYNSQGNKLINLNSLKSREEKIDVSSLIPGLYIIVIPESNWVKTIIVN